jgi:peptidoglycan/LPS O-acetylase OafA/YrhL
MKEKSEKLYHIELLRFIFSVIIVYYHILHANIMNNVGTAAEQYKALNTSCDYAWMIVECFFILAGFFLYFSFWRNPEQSFGSFVQKKIARLWPVFAFSVILGIIFFKQKIGVQIFNLFFLWNVGIGKAYGGINWYISPYFWTMLFYFGLLKCVKQKKSQNLIIAILVYFSYVITNQNGFGRETIDIGISLAMIRAVASIGMGYLLAVITESFEPFLQALAENKTKDIIFRIFVSVLEIICCACLTIHFLYKKYAYNAQFIVIIEFSILLLCLVSKKGILSILFNHKYFDIGKYSYSIYVMQQTIFWALQRSFWKTSIVQSNIPATIILSLVICVISGIIVYKFIEKPFGKLLSKPLPQKIPEVENVEPGIEEKSE